MDPRLNKIFHFGLLFLPLFLVFMALYVAVLPVYPPLVHGAANLISERLSPPSSLRFENGSWAAYILVEGGRPRFLGRWDEFHWLYVNVALLPALLLATPCPWRSRLRLLAMGLALLPVVHVVTILALSRGYVCLAEAPGTFVCLWLLRGVYTSGQVLAVAIWVVLTWRYWLGWARRADAPETTAA